jgi:hypothetical protein
MNNMALSVFKTAFNIKTYVSSHYLVHNDIKDSFALIFCTPFRHQTMRNTKHRRNLYQCDVRTNSVLFFHCHSNK